MLDFVLHKVKHNDEIWVSKDCIETNTPLEIGDYYCINENGKFEMYEDQIFCQLFILIGATFANAKRKWYQFWKPKRIINGYKFKCVDLEEKK